MVNINFQLKEYNTFALSAVASSFFSFRTEEELINLIHSGKTSEKKILILGGGSNILFTGDFDGLVIHPEIGGIEVEERNDKYVIVSAGSGIIWDDFVGWCVSNGFSGVENLSLIPGRVGASPVQNIGAYGVEAGNVITKVRFINLSDGVIAETEGKECRFGYRDSIFKHELKGNVIVTRVWYRLCLAPALNTSYGDVASETAMLGGVTLQNIRQAIINIRRRKLPDPAETGNAGSFFKNPVVTEKELTELLLKYPEMPHYDQADGGSKLAAGWLIERCGWKGYRSGNAGVHPRQALVLVNYGEANGKEITALAEKIRDSVESQFGIDLSYEVEII